QDGNLREDRRRRRPSTPCCVWRDEGSSREAERSAYDFGCRSQGSRRFDFGNCAHSVWKAPVALSHRERRTGSCGNQQTDGPSAGAAFECVRTGGSDAAREQRLGNGVNTEIKVSVLKRPTAFGYRSVVWRVLQIWGCPDRGSVRSPTCEALRK